MSLFWLNSPESLMNLNVTDVNGILNLITVLVILGTLYGICINAPNALNLGMLSIIILIIIYSCGEGQLTCFDEEFLEKFGAGSPNPDFKLFAKTLLRC